MRYIGCLLMVLAGAGMGLYAGHRLHRQCVYIRQTARVLQVLERQLAYTARPMADLWRQLALSEAYADCALLQDTAAALADQPFAVAFTAAVERAQTAGWLTPVGYSLLQEFGEGCGRYDLTRQTEHIHQYRRQLEDLAAALEGGAAVKGRLYRTAGWAGGLALALLLL